MLKAHNWKMFLLGVCAALRSSFAIIFAFFQAKIVNEILGGHLSPKSSIIAIIGMFGYIISYYFISTQMYECYYKETKDYRFRVMSGFYNRNVAEHHVEENGEYVSKLITETGEVAGGFFMSKLNILINGIAVSVALVGLLFLQPLLGIMELLGTVSVTWIVSKFASTLQNKQEDLQFRNECLTTKTMELLGGIIELHNYNAEKKAKNQYLECMGAAEQSKLALKNAYLVSELLSVGGNMLIYLLLFIWGSLLVIKGRCSIGEVLSISILVNEIMIAANSLSSNIAQIRSTRTLKKELDSLANQNTSTFVSPKLQENTLVGISLHKVSFSYGEREIFKNLSFDVSQGEKVALMGESGVGKSTLLKCLIMRETGLEGSCMICEKNLHEYSEEELYQKIAYVPQVPMVFSGTVAENITMFSAVDADRLEYAMKMSGLTNVLTPDTILEYNGTNISGGQKLRVELARAIYSEKKLWLLDEIYSSLDKQTGEEIEKRIAAVPNVTALVVTHRLFDKENYQKIITLTREGGVI